MTRIDPTTLAKAREWTQLAVAHETSEVSRAAAEVIDNLPDQIIDAEKVRELLDRWAVNPFPTSDEVAVLNDVEALLPTPPLPTLADLIEQGHDPAQYQWRQAEHRDERCIIIRESGYPSRPIVSLLTATGATIWTSTDEVIPLPGKPRLVWPAESRPEPAEEETPEPETPRPEDVKPGVPWSVEHDGHEWVGQRAWGDVKVPWIVTRVVPGGDADFEYCHDNEVTLVSRLVPEVAPKVLATEEDYRNMPRDTVVKDTTYPVSDVWDKWYENEWRTATRSGSSKSHTNAEMADTTRQVIWAPEVQA